MRTLRNWPVIVSVVGLMLSACGAGTSRHASPASAELAAARQKIKHVIVIMQENRSFDSYFGTFPGADGIPAHVCVPSSMGGCQRPFHDRSLLNSGGPHGVDAAAADVNSGRMDGFVRQAQTARRSCIDPLDPACGGPRTDVMGYHTDAEIPNYWTYARTFVLQDHMFESVASWSRPAHLYLVSGWSARCTVGGDASSCSSDANATLRGIRKVKKGRFAWTDITYLLHAHHVSWAYYVDHGYEPDCANDDAVTCAPVKQSSGVPGIWNPLPSFTTVRQDRQVKNVQPLGRLTKALAGGTLPAVAWIVPNRTDSEHPPASVRAGERYVTNIINEVMKSKYWDSTAIFVAWDDWGGFYDHVVPPKVDGEGYGLRVPALVVSAYAKRGFIDHQTLSFDAYLKFIEDLFLNGQRLDPQTDGRPDKRPDVRENASILGDLLNDFDFSQPPRKPLVLPLR